jgi:predicted DNA-binding protein (UPF0251 family)
MSERPKPHPQRRFDCRACKKFNGCNGLCPKAEAYAGKDEIKQREETIGTPVIVQTVKFMTGAGVTLTKREREIVMLSEIHGFSRAETAKFLKISRENLRNHLSRIRKKIPPEVA